MYLVTTWISVNYPKLSNSSPNFFVDLIRYFGDQADDIQTQASKAGIFDNKGDIGSTREDILFDFLSHHIPTRSNIIKGGFVFDSLGNRSRQIDLMICNDQTFQFKQSQDNKTKSFNCVEGCFAVISVKSFLNKQSLTEALDNLGSLPTTKKLKVNPFLTNGKDIIKTMPQKYIFAYRGDSKDTINKYCEEYYSTHTLENAPDMIVVNNECYFSRAGPKGIKGDDGELVPPGQYVMIDKSSSNYVGATALFQLISRILTVSVWSPHIEIDFEAYTDNIDKTIAEEHKKNPVKE